MLHIYSPAVSQVHDNAKITEVEQAAVNFVNVFNNLDWPRFEASWAQDATVFFPIKGLPKRVEGRSAIVATFLSIFENVPKERPGPPYLSIRPMDLHVQMLGDSAVVTFHLGESEPLNRRSLVFVKREGKWLIAHLHASRSFAPASQ